MPFLIGTNTDEGSVFAANAATRRELVSFLADNYTRLAASNAVAVLSHYPLPMAPALPKHAAWFPSERRVDPRLAFETRQC